MKSQLSREFNIILNKVKSGIKSKTKRRKELKIFMINLLKTRMKKHKKMKTIKMLKRRREMS